MIQVPNLNITGKYFVFVTADHSCSGRKSSNLQSTLNKMGETSGVAPPVAKIINIGQNSRSEVDVMIALLEKLAWIEKQLPQRCEIDYTPVIVNAINSIGYHYINIRKEWNISMPHRNLIRSYRYLPSKLPTIQELDEDEEQVDSVSESQIPNQYRKN